MQPDGRGPGLGRQPGPGRASPHCSHCPRLRPRCVAGATLGWQGKRSHQVFSHTNPGTTHRLSQRQAPSSPSHFTSQNAAPDRAGRCTDPMGAGRARAAVRAGQTPLWPGVELCHSLKTHALSGPGRQLCTKQAGSKLDRDIPSFLPPSTASREGRQSRAGPALLGSAELLLSSFSWQPPF